jgi:hypothetical protein
MTTPASESLRNRSVGLPQIDPFRPRRWRRRLAGSDAEGERLGSLCAGTRSTAGQQAAGFRSDRR